MCNFVKKNCRKFAFIFVYRFLTILHLPVYNRLGTAVTHYVVADYKSVLHPDKVGHHCSKACGCCARVIYTSCLKFLWLLVSCYVAICMTHFTSDWDVDFVFVRLKVVGELPTLSVGLTDQRVTEILQILVSIPLPESPTATVDDEFDEFAASVSTSLRLYSDLTSDRYWGV